MEYTPSTRFGLKDPAAIMDAFHQIGTETLQEVLRASSAPQADKTLRTWGINAAAEMIGRSTQTIRQLEQKNRLLGEPSVLENGKRYYTLERINQMRDELGTRFKRPPLSEAIILAVSNFKGGVAKTTTSILLAQKCALDGLRVLVIDLDPQASFTLLFGLMPDIHLVGDDTVATALLDDPADITRVIRKTYFTGIDLIPGNLALTNVELCLPNPSVNNSERMGSPLKRLHKALLPIKENYDVIIFDCGPNLGALTINAVTAANAMLVPIPPAMPDFGSYIRLTETLTDLFNAVQPKLEFFRILLTKHKGTNAANQLDSIMREKFGSLMIVNHMVETVEIENTNNALSSLYEKPPTGTNSKAFRRAFEAANQVNNEIISAFKDIWDAQSNLKMQMNNPKAEQEDSSYVKEMD